MHYLKLGNDILIFCCFVSASINLPAQRAFAVPIQQLQVSNEFQQEQQLGQIRQQGQLLQEEQQQQHVAEEQTLQPISFDRISAMPIT